MKSFDALGLPRPLLLALSKMQFSAPTPIQAQAIPVALEGRDILGSAQTGTGKTAAFAIPMIAHVLRNPSRTALVMTPTRELAAQVHDAARLMMAGYVGEIKTALLIGGQSMSKQLHQLRTRPRIVIGTPGRINDHLQQGSLNLSACDFLVLDETDRMLDMGFEVQIDRIVRKLPSPRQTLLFSATLPARIVKIADKYLKSPQRIAVGSTHTPIERIKQEVLHMAVADKYAQLLEQLRRRSGSVIVFVRTKRGADRLAQKLNKEKQSAEAIHGNLSQNQRNRVIQSFRDMKHRIMVATDVAARGLDIPHIEHVINYDLPQVPEDYIHRIGRTARAGAEGEAVCFVTPEDTALWRDIHALMNPQEKPARQAQRHGERERSDNADGRHRHGRQGQRANRHAHGKGGNGGNGGRTTEGGKKRMSQGARSDRNKAARRHPSGKPSRRP